MIGLLQGNVVLPEQAVLLNQLQLGQHALMDIQMGAQNTGHLVVFVTLDDQSVVSDPQPTAIALFAPVIDAVGVDMSASEKFEVVHDPGIILRMDQVLPGEHILLELPHFMTQHPVPARAAQDLAGDPVPIPGPLPQQIKQIVQGVVGICKTTMPIDDCGLSFFHGKPGPARESGGASSRAGSQHGALCTV